MANAAIMPHGADLLSDPQRRPFCNAHVIRLFGGTKYVVHCSCGYLGDETRLHAAQEEARDHEALDRLDRSCDTQLALVLPVEVREL